MAVTSDRDAQQGPPWPPAAGDGQPQATPPTRLSSAGLREAAARPPGLWPVPCSFSFYCASVAWAAWCCATMEVTAGCGPSLAPPSSRLWDNTLQKGQKLLVCTRVQPPGSSRVPSVFKGLDPHHHSRSANRPAVS